MRRFDVFVYNSESDSHRDVVGLAVYYLHTYGEENVVRVQDVRDLIGLYDSAMSGTAVAAHVAELEEEGLLTRNSQNQHHTTYLLTQAGFRIFGRLAGEWGEYGSRDGRFIDTDQVDDEDYELLLTNINRSYRNMINDGTLVLVRKLYENLVIDILRAEFGPQRIDLYFNTDRGRHHGLGGLCNNLRDNISNLQHYSRQLDDDLIDRIEEFKVRGMLRHTLFVLVLLTMN